MRKYLDLLAHIVRLLTAVLMVVFGTMSLITCWRLVKLGYPVWMTGIALIVGIAMLAIGLYDWFRLQKQPAPRKESRPSGPRT